MAAIELTRHQSILKVLFFISGFAALLYQVVWQRTLFAIYGINIESVTMVVTAFMLGLGLGSLAGGAISENPKRSTVVLFAIVEGAIGLYGVVSLRLFHVVGEATLRAAPWVIALVTFLMVLVPTMLMGSTLPLLVAHFTRRSRNVGESVGTLYFVNTLGSAFASLASVFVLFGYLGQTNTVRVAAFLNAVACATALVLAYRAQEQRAA
jgi:predicted membrane-bound spermidine synthase